MKISNTAQPVLDKDKVQTFDKDWYHGLLYKIKRILSYFNLLKCCLHKCEFEAKIQQRSIDLKNPANFVFTLTEAFLRVAFLAL